VKASMNIQLVRIQLVTGNIGSKMNYIAFAPTTHPVTQIGHIAMSVIIEKGMNITVSVIVCE
jgi:hypothetical protein